MADADQEVRALIEGWAAAVHGALLRCGTADEFRENPNRRLRLTIGLQKRDGRWVVTHEHHSFAA